MVCVAARVLDGVLPLSGWSPLCPTLWVAGFFCPKRLLQARRRQSAAACLGERRGAAAGIQNQASLVQPPLPLYRD